MDYEGLVQKAMAFIHNNYAEGIQVSDVADHVYLSPVYLSRIYRALTGCTVKAYINRYRLYKAAVDLCETEKRIVSITYEHGFSSQQAFTRSFLSEYRIPPARFRRLGRPASPFPAENLLSGGKSMDLNQSFENFRLVKKDSFLIAGIETRIDYNKSLDCIGDLWQRWINEKVADSIPDKVGYPVVYGMTDDTAEDDTAIYRICVEVSSLDGIPEGIVGRRMGALEYAAFDTTLAIIWTGEFWRTFYKTWLPASGYTQPEMLTTNNGMEATRLADIEVYDRIPCGEQDIMHIYAPILWKP